MFNLDKKLNKNSEQAVTHDQNLVSELQDSMVTLAEITKKRIYVQNFPYSAVNYDAADNYRKTGVDPESESLKELGRGIQSSGLQQPIGLFAASYDANSLADVLNNPMNLAIADTWVSPISTIFGNRRYLAITHHTDLTHEAAYLYPKEAEPFLKTIAFIENMDRENVALIEEATGLYDEVVARFDGNISGFARFSGKSPADLNKIFKIGEAARKDETFCNVITQEKSSDIVALDNLARAILVNNSDTRNANIEKLIKELKGFDGKLVKFREKAIEARKYAEGKINKLPKFEQPVNQSNAVEPPKAESTRPAQQKQKYNAASLDKKLSGLISYIDNVSSDQLTEENQTLISDLKQKLNELTQ